MEWYYVCWPWLTAKRVEPVVSISWASCFIAHQHVIAHTARYWCSIFVCLSVCPSYPLFTFDDICRRHWSPIYATGRNICRRPVKHVKARDWLMGMIDLYNASSEWPTIQEFRPIFGEMMPKNDAIFLCRRQMWATFVSKCEQTVMLALFRNGSTSTTSTICGDACPLSCASAEAYKLAQCTRPQGWGS